MVPETILRVGYAIARVLGRVCPRPRIIIGKDTRLSGYMIEAALQAGCLAGGAYVWPTGPLPTPAIAHLTRTLRMQAGIMVTASHNLFEDNGVKVFDPNGFKLPDETEGEIEQEVASGVCVQAPGKAYRMEDGVGRYSEYCKGTIPFSLRLPSAMKIVVDCAHGAMYHVAPMLFRELGGTVVAIYDKPDGRNINQGCGALHPEVLAAAVLEHNAHVGVAFDGDGDRVMLVDSRGRIYNGDQLLYIMAADAQKKNKLCGGVVGTLMSNVALECALAEIHVPFTRSAVGDRYVLETLHARGWQLGGEACGHIVMLDRHTTGDGLVSALHILAIMAETGLSLEKLAEPIQLFPQRTINVPGRLKLTARLQEKIDELNRECNGLGRVFCRPSGTEPVTRVTAEHEDRATAERLVAAAASLVEQAMGKVPS
jgi:phosphoglucosamine mutase